MTTSNDICERLLKLADDQDCSLENDIWCVDELREAADHIQSQDATIAALRARMEWLEEKYRDLIMQVATKWLNETRHETAKRYIQQAEELGGEQTSALGEKP